MKTLIQYNPFEKIETVKFIDDVTPTKSTVLSVITTTVPGEDGQPPIITKNLQITVDDGAVANTQVFPFSEINNIIKLLRTIATQ